MSKWINVDEFCEIKVLNWGIVVSLKVDLKNCNFLEVGDSVSVIDVNKRGVVIKWYNLQKRSFATLFKLQNGNKRFSED